MWVNCPDVSKALWPSLSRVVSPSSISYFELQLIDDGDTTLDNEGHGAFKTSGQFTHIRLYSPDDALIVRNINLEILWVFICGTWPSIPVFKQNIFFIIGLTDVNWSPISGKRCVVAWCQPGVFSARLGILFQENPDSTWSSCSVIQNSLDLQHICSYT